MTDTTMENASDKLFISHSTKNDDLVRGLRQALELHGQDAWVDSRELRGGDPLWPEIQAAISNASAYAVLVSPDSLQSKWVGKELQYALDIQKQRGKDKFRVIALSLDETKLGVLESFFEEEPVYIGISNEAGGIEEALNDILIALGKRLGTDVIKLAQPPAEPLEELVLELSHLKFTEDEGKPRACGEARLVYEPASSDKRTVKSDQNWLFTAQFGPFEAAELKWYLEQYAVWPNDYFATRARKVEENLASWGKLLFKAAMPTEYVSDVLAAWAKVETTTEAKVNRRFSIFVDASTLVGASEDEVTATKGAATQLLGLPWELLHNGSEFLFQGKQPVRVRRRLPNTQHCDVAVVKPPVRILLITARPEDDACAYIDHRASAGPLVSAMEALGSLVELTVLNPATLPALAEELERQTYHVVHFDGHGVYNRTIGLGGLCFEHPQDTGKLKGRRHQTIYTQELGPLLNKHNIPLVFLEACQTATSEEASESVASELLQRGIASVVAMSHSVLVSTAARFVAEFYKKLTQGARVGEAMLAGQRKLKNDSFRGKIFGAGELRLDDWFVPVLFQEKADPQLFVKIQQRQTRADIKQAVKSQLDKLPAPTEFGFIGRSRDLLALERLLQLHHWAVVIGQGGEGKTALASEFARWMIRSRQVSRVAFVSVEENAHIQAVLDALGQQLIINYSTAEYDSIEKALLPVERALKEQDTLLVMDNMESILLPPYVLENTPDALQQENLTELTAILEMCEKLNSIGKTRIVFTSRENLPVPFSASNQMVELRSLATDDAIKLVERTLNAADNSNTARQDSAQNTPETTLETTPQATEVDDIKELVAAVNYHARSLTLLAPSLQRDGAKATTQKLVTLMQQMQGSREQSLYASVELSLQRLSPENRKHVKVLGLFHGGVNLAVLKVMMEWEQDFVDSLAQELLAIGLATLNPYRHLSLNAALCPYLHQELFQSQQPSQTKEHSQLQDLQPRWQAAMMSYVNFLEQQQTTDIQLAATLTHREIPNLFALLEQVVEQDDGETIIDLCTSLYSLLQGLGKPRLLARVAQVRDAAETTLADSWNHARFEVKRIRIEQQLQQGQLQDAFTGAEHLLQQAKNAGDAAYNEADYDLAMAHRLLGQVMKTVGAAEQALEVLNEAFHRFEHITAIQQNKSAEGMASVCLAELGDCLSYMGRYDEAVNAYENNIRRAEKLRDYRQVAVGKGQLGTVYMYQKEYKKALEAHAQAREGFEQLGEPAMVAVAWHQTARVYEEMQHSEAAENAYRQSLAINVQQGDIAGQATTLGQLGNLYDDQLRRTEEAVALLQQAVDKYTEIGDIAGEGRLLSNLADSLRKLKRLSDARQAILRAIECKSQFGDDGEPWKSWGILSDIEKDEGNSQASNEARHKAFECYLAYRRDGGENHFATGRLAYDITQLLLAGEVSQAETVLQKTQSQFHEAGFGTFHSALQTIVAGSRDAIRVEDTDFHYEDAAEILILLEALDAGGDT